MFETLNVPILGVVENMAGDFFGTGGGEKLATERDVPFLGRIPLDAEVRKGGDYGRPIVVTQPENPAAIAFQKMAQAIAARTSVVDATNQRRYSAKCNRLIPRSNQHIPHLLVGNVFSINHPFP